MGGEGVFEPGAVVKSTVVSAFDAPGSRTTSTRRILLAGEPLLYLQALSELLDSIPGVSASLVQPGEIGHAARVDAPALILLGCPPTSDGPVELSGSLRKSYPGVPLVLLDSGTARDSAEKTASLKASAWFSTSVSLDELVKGLCNPTNPTGTRAKRHSPRPEHRGEWPQSSLSERELTVLRLVVSGRSNNEIAEALGISRHTVRTHLQNVMAKILVRSKTELVSVAMRSGIRAGTSPVTRDA